MATRVPGSRLARERLWSPRSLTVMRMRFAVGTAESEYGCACHHRSFFRNRQWRN
jgi:hypothetical protein